MFGPKLLNMTDQLTANNRLLGFGLIVMLIWNVFNFTMLGKIQAKTQVVVMPNGGDDGLMVGHGKASERYVRRMARYVVSQIGTYNAATARDQLFELLELFPPEAAGTVQSSFERLAAEIERYPSISSSVRWTGDKPLQYDENTIQVMVRKARLVNGSQTEVKSVAYCMRYRIDETRFWLTNLVEKDDPSDQACFINKNSKKGTPDA